MYIIYCFMTPTSFGLAFNSCGRLGELGWYFRGRWGRRGCRRGCWHVQWRRHRGRLVQGWRGRGPIEAVLGMRQLGGEVAQELVVGGSVGIRGGVRQGRLVVEVAQGLHLLRDQARGRLGVDQRPLLQVVRGPVEAQWAGHRLGDGRADGAWVVDAVVLLDDFVGAWRLMAIQGRHWRQLALVKLGGVSCRNGSWSGGRTG